MSVHPPQKRLLLAFLQGLSVLYHLYSVVFHYPRVDFGYVVLPQFPLSRPRPYFGYVVVHIPYI